MKFRKAITVGEHKSSVACPITARACEGDLSHLCEDYGCLRKAGLSPRSEENFDAAVVGGE